MFGVRMDKLQFQKETDAQYEASIQSFKENDLLKQRYGEC